MAKITKSLQELETSLVKPLEKVAITRQEGKTRVGFAIDRSASMYKIVGPTVKAYNQQLKVIREKSAHEVRSYLVLFNHTVSHILTDEPVHALCDMRDKDFKPDGSTALLDAIGELSKKMESRSPEDHHLLIAISDGQENSSGIWDWLSLEKRIRNLQETGSWTFVFIGPKEAADEMRAMGFKTENVLAVAQNLLPAALERSSKSLGRFLEARNNDKLLPAYFGGHQ